jgi:hypothetical protein
MKRIGYPLAVCALLIGTLWGGIQSGHTANRWGDNEGLLRAAEQLRKPPAGRLGNWRLQREEPFSEDVVQMLQCPAHFCRTYLNDQTGETINVAVVVGPPGPISVHSPEVCYSSQDFKVTGGRTGTKILDRNEKEHSLWELKLQSSGANPMPLRVVFGWGTGGAWAASQNPRFDYAGLPYLYKIQLATAATDSSDENNTYQDFLKAFLADLESCLIPFESSSRLSTNTSPRKPE